MGRSESAEVWIHGHRARCRLVRGICRGSRSGEQEHRGGRAGRRPRIVHCNDTHLRKARARAAEGGWAPGRWHPPGGRRDARSHPGDRDGVESGSRATPGLPTWCGRNRARRRGSISRRAPGPNRDAGPEPPPCRIHSNSGPCSRSQPPFLWSCCSRISSRARSGSAVSWPWPPYPAWRMWMPLRCPWRDSGWIRSTRGRRPLGIGIAAATNTIAKCVMSGVIGTVRLAAIVGERCSFLGLAAGGATLMFTG